jgi:EAL and modified HD-GYP domain-containing signal transduction protein
LSYNLLRMVNSAASGLPQKINSIKQSIALLGRKQLQRWIQLLLYTNDSSGDGGNMANALLQTAAARGKLMELIAAVERPHDKMHQERAFMVGILSLLDTLLGIEMQQIIDKLSIPEDMSNALLNRSGRLGQELKLIEANETSELGVVKSLLSELGFLTQSKLTDLELETLGWVNRIGEAAH